jgi:tetratricopeptide (TPR) repeat protein
VKSKKRGARKSPLALVFFGLAAGILLCELCARALLWREYRAALREGFYPEKAVAAPEDAWSRYDPLLGWSNRPGWADPENPHLPRIDARGFRGDDEIPVPKPAGLRRVVVVGDSFAFGAEVANEETWARRLGDLLKGKADVANLGVCAYGVDQMLLRFERDGAVLQPDLVVAGMILDDFARSDASVWHTGQGKPRFALRDGKLELLNVPPPPRVAPGQWLKPPEPTLASVLRLAPVLPGFLAGRRPLNVAAAEDGELSELHKALLLRLRDDARKAGAGFAVLLMAWQEQVDHPPPLRLSLLGFCAAHGIEIVDTYPVFEKSPRGLLKGHPGPLGHQVIAKTLYQAILRRPLLTWDGAPPPDRAGLDPLTPWLSAPQTPAAAGRTLAQMQSLTAAHPERSWLWLEQAKVALEAGKRDQAREALGRWSENGAAPDQVREAALVFESLGDSARALALLDGLVKKNPADARALADRGVCRYRLGRVREGAADLERSLALEPARLETYASLGAVEEARGRPAAAAALYDRALALRAPKGAPGLRAMIERDRRRLGAP